jgi:16S rRNA (guanine(966)-N(2))-methyltransferase RsmD
MQTRPTSDRLRETLFSILAPRLDGCRFVDLYAGTGAVGIEALSRGAAHVWFAENAAPALAAMRANFTALKIERGFTVEDRGVGAALQRLGKLTQPVDVVFVDPPYEAEAEYTGTLGFLGSDRGRKILAEDALVIAEHGSKTKLATRYGALVQVRGEARGCVAYVFCVPGGGEKPPP